MPRDPLPNREAVRDANPTALQALFQQIVAHAASAITTGTADGDIDTSAQDLLTEIEYSDAAAASLVDVLWLQTSLPPPVLAVAAVVVEASTEEGADPKPDTPSPPPPQHSHTLFKLIHAVAHHSSAIYTGLLQSLDAAVLQAAGLVEEKELQKKVRQYNTSHHYKQSKFNLLAEDSQGYAKLLRLLTASETQESSSTTTEADNELVQSVCNLMGTFGLDPVRCLDLSVDWMEHAYFTGVTDGSSDKPVHLLPLIRKLPTDKLPKLLGFKLSNPNRKDYTSVLQCMMWLVVTDVLQLSDMWPHLPPWMPVLQETLAAVTVQTEGKVRAMGRTTLGGSTGKDKETAVDVQPVRNTMGVSWLHLFLQSKHWPLIESALSADTWSAMCVLFPESVGGAILDWVSETYVSVLYEQLVPPVPWCQDDKGKDVAMKEATAVVSLSDFVTSISKPLSLTVESGAIRLRPILYSQLCRIFKELLSDDETDADNQDACLDFMRNFLLPSLGQFPPNPALTLEVWAIVEQFSYTNRYSLYRSWRGSGLDRAALTSNKPLWLVAGELQAGKDVRYALKRLSKDTIRDTSRAVAKVCHSHPLVVFTIILNQIEAYDNLVQVMVDCLRFVTPLSLDILGFCILSRLCGSAGGVNRSRLKEDGVNVSQWLQSLESFTGAFFKSFPFIELRGILCYLMRRLKDGHVMELGVLRTLLKTSGGWAFADYSPAASLSKNQLEGRGGSTLLKRETMSFGVFQDFNLRSSNEIRKVLQVDDMGVSLLVLLAQVRHQIVFESTKGPPKPVKLIGNLVDTCQVVMAILLDFLTDSTDEKATSLIRFAQTMPSLVKLQAVYGLDVASAWMLCRPLIRAAAMRSDAGEANDGEIVDDADDTSDALSDFKSTETSRLLYQGMLPATAWTHISVSLFETFYANALYDLSCPEEIYKAEIGRLNKEVERLSRAALSPAPTAVLQVQPTTTRTLTDEEELARVKRAATALSSDLPKQRKHAASIRKSFEGEKAAFFKSEEVSKAAALTLLERCIYPRCMQGPDDAMYCARFISLLHETETPGFGTLHLLDVMIVTLSRALFGMTEGEAANASILLFETWTLVSKWRYSETAFQEEVAGKTGSFMESDDQQGLEAVSYKDFEALYNKWHAAIGAAVIGCLKSSEYMHTRNSLIVLTRMVEVYPTRPKLGHQFISALAPLQDESYRLADIRASAQAYSMQLLKARDDGSWKEEDVADVQARQKKEQAAAAIRRKKAEEQRAEMRRDTQKIDEEIGVEEQRGRGSGGRPGDRSGDRGGDRGRRPPPPAAAVGRDQQASEIRRGGPVNIGSHTFEFEPASRGGMDNNNRGGPPRDGPREGPRDDRWPRGGGGGARRDNSPPRHQGPPPRRGEDAPNRVVEGRSPRRGEDAPNRGLEGRWERSAGDREGPGRGDRDEPRGGASRGSKRTRDITPVREDGERDETSQPRNKRSRVDAADGGNKRSDEGRRTGSRKRGGRK